MGHFKMLLKIKNEMGITLFNDVYTICYLINVDFQIFKFRFLNFEFLSSALRCKFFFLHSDEVHVLMGI